MTARCCCSGSTERRRNALPADEAWFELECRIVERGGDWPAAADQPPPPAWTARSPFVAAGYGRKLARDGRFGEAKAMLAAAVRGFARLGAVGPLRAGIAWMADVSLHLGDATEAETGLRLLRRETEANETGEEADGTGSSYEGWPDAWFALGRGGFLVGLEADERLRCYARAVVQYAREGRAERTLEAAYEWRRLADALPEAPEHPGAVLLELRQKAAWQKAYALPVRLLESANASSEDIDAAAWGPYYMALGRVTALRRRWPGSSADEPREAERAAASVRERFSADVELQAECLLLTALRCRDMGRKGEADAALQETERLFAFGLAPEYTGRIAAVAAASDGVRTAAVLGALPAAALPAARPEAARPAPVMPVRVRCFGGLVLEREGLLLPQLRWKRRKAQELFLLLLLRPGHAMPKEQAIDVLFGGEHDPAKASNQLYVAIHEVRRALLEALGWEDGAVLRDGVVSLPERNIEEVDVEKYLTLVRVADQLQADQHELSEELYEAAAELYGPLLPNKPYLEWLERLRDDLELRQGRVLGRLYDAAVRRGAYALAERYLRARLELEPHQEEAAQALLKLLQNTGRTAEAVRMYEAFERRLGAELGANPSEEIRRLAASIVRKL